jgi:hypothetical protein
VNGAIGPRYHRHWGYEHRSAYRPITGTAIITDGQRPRAFSPRKGGAASARRDPS